MKLEYRLTLDFNALIFLLFAEAVMKIACPQFNYMSLPIWFHACHWIQEIGS